VAWSFGAHEQEGRQRLAWSPIVGGTSRVWNQVEGCSMSRTAKGWASDGTNEMAGENLNENDRGAW